MMDLLLLKRYKSVETMKIQEITTKLAVKVIIIRTILTITLLILIMVVYRIKQFIILIGRNIMKVSYLS